MIKIYSIAIDDCRDCPNCAHSILVDETWCKNTGKIIDEAEITNAPHFPAWCPLKTHTVSLRE